MQFYYIDLIDSVCRVIQDPAYSDNLKLFIMHMKCKRWESNVSESEFGTCFLI